MKIAKSAGINAFALNFVFREATTSLQLPNAFSAAKAVGRFKLFFSFNYASNSL